MLIRRSDDWLAARAGTEIMMMNASRGTYLGLNPMGARIWDLLDQPREVDWICARLLEEFAVSDIVCRAEVDAFVAELGKHKAVELIAP